MLVEKRKIFVSCFLVFCLLSLFLAPWLGEDFFPTVDAGQFLLHVRAKTGTRIEETARDVDEVERYIRSQIPANELTGTLDNIGVPTSGIMCIGVATSNSVLVVTFANEHFAQSGNSIQAALEAGATRLRPVIMTALAMIIGMIPMALGLGDGGEQNAPLGRAVIGGLLFATVATLFFVPIIFAMIRQTKTQPIPTSEQVH
jgi:multidrug efflux pump subunit AcrB